MDTNRRLCAKMGVTKNWSCYQGSDEDGGRPEERKFDRRVRILALVMGAFNDERTKILLDTGANTSSMSETFARTLRLRRLMINDKQIDVQGIGKSEVVTTSRATVKVNPGWEVVYEFEV